MEARFVLCSQALLTSNRRNIGTPEYRVGETAVWCCGGFRPGSTLQTARGFVAVRFRLPSREKRRQPQKETTRNGMLKDS